MDVKVVPKMIPIDVKVNDDGSLTTKHIFAIITGDCDMNVVTQAITNGYKDIDIEDESMKLGELSERVKAETGVDVTLAALNVMLG